MLPMPKAKYPRRYPKNGKLAYRRIFKKTPRRYPNYSLVAKRRVCLRGEQDYALNENFRDQQGIRYARAWWNGDIVSMHLTIS